jgi:biotin-(acetyl-CoA carboxylase) ligase
MTMLLPAGFADGEALPLRVGLGVVRALEIVGTTAPEDAGSARSAPTVTFESQWPKFWLKWPNDVLVQKNADRVEYGKLCGILCEKAEGRILIGIGVNVRRLEDKIVSAQSQPGIPPVCLEETWGVLPEVFAELDIAAHFVARHVADALSDSRWRVEYERRLWRRGSTVQFLAGHPESPTPVLGTCMGVDEGGRLMLDIGGALKTFASGEIASLRPV